MSDTQDRTAGPQSPRSDAHAEPEAIRAIRLRHPWRNVFAVVLVVVAALFIYDAAFNRPTFDWPTVGKYVFDVRVFQALGYTLQLTIYSMVIAIVLGVAIAVMRQSPNPVVKSVAWVYLWLFRGTPVYVQLTFWGLIATIYQKIEFGIPGQEAWISIKTQDYVSLFALAVIGLALNEAAYMAEIVRAGLLAVDTGQGEAATALGLGWWHTMSRVILPQAMRVIIPPTGNEVISMLKTTSLVTAVPFSLELFTRTHDIGLKGYTPVPLLIVASIWYLVATSILMVGQFYLERYFAKGAGDRPNVQNPTIETQAVAVVGQGSGHPTYRTESGGESIVPPHERPGGGGA